MNRRRKNFFSLKLTSAIIFALTIYAPLLLGACADKREHTEVIMQTPTPAPSQNSAATEPTQTQSPAATATPTPKPPQASEVDNKLARIFQGAVQIDAAQGSALVGDFNGDGSEDIAVVVKPAADKLEELNSEVANWILGDAQNAPVPDPNKAVQKLPEAKRVRVQPGDVLLAVIHGYGQGGWRNPQAQQAYLLRNATGLKPRVEPMKVAADEFKLIIPHKSADIIREEIGSASGFIYWTGGKYAWLAPAKSKR